GRDVTHRARAWTLGDTKGLAHQVRDIGFVLAPGLGGLDKHDCYAYRAHNPLNTSIKYVNHQILLATKRFRKLPTTRENQKRGEEVRPTARSRSRSLHRDVKFPAVLFGLSAALPELSHAPAD